MALQDAIPGEAHGRRSDDPVLSPVFTIIAAVCFAVLAGLVTLNTVLDYRGSSLLQTGRTSATWPVGLLVGETELSVPANYFRFDDQRIPGKTGSVDLHAVWPDLSGYTDRNRRTFNDPSDASALVYISVSEPESLLDTSSRFLALLPYLGQLPDSPDKNGLGIVRHAAAAPGLDETIFYSFNSGARLPYVAICDRTSAKGAAVCRREIHTANGLSLTYRFREGLLADWRQLDLKIRDFADRIGA